MPKIANVRQLIGVCNGDTCADDFLNLFFYLLNKQKNLSNKLLGVFIFDELTVYPCMTMVYLL